MTTINIILATLIILTFLIAIQLCKETFILGSPMRGHEYYPDQTPLQQSIEKRYEQLIAGRYPDYKTRGFPDYPGLQSDLANLRRQAEQETSETRQQQRTRTPYTSRPRSPQKQQQRTRTPYTSRPRPTSQDTPQPRHSWAPRRSTVQEREMTLTRAKKAMERERERERKGKRKKSKTKRKNRKYTK